MTARDHFLKSLEGQQDFDSEPSRSRSTMKIMEATQLQDMLITAHNQALESAAKLFDPSIKDLQREVVRCRGEGPGSYVSAEREAKSLENWKRKILELKKP